MTTVLERPAPAGAGVVADAGDGGVAARRAMVRWAWRMFRREWRQQMLILALIVVAVAATFVGAAVAVDTQAPAHAGFGTAQDAATYQAPVPHLTADIAALQKRFGPVDVIENQTLTVPGSITTYDLRSQNPHGPFGQPLLALVSGHYPSGPGQVALTGVLASTLHLGVGGLWHEGGQTRRIVGIVQNPQSLLDEFALVVPGQVTTPTGVTVLFDAGAVAPGSIGANVQSAASASASTGNVLNPETIVLTLATLGMLLIALVAVGGFTVLAQRRLRSIGMLGALGATDKNIRLVVRANGVVVGLVGTVVGAALGFLAWAAYRPHAEASSHHEIGLGALPWNVIVPAMILAVVATYFAAARPARSVTKVPIVTALSGRPASPKRVHRSAVPGVIVLVVSFFLLSGAGGGHGGGPGPELPLGLVGLIVSIVLLSPLCLALLARGVSGAPVAVRVAVRDLARYRSRSGSALAAISLGVLIAVLICVLSASRYGNVLDYAGPNMTSNQLIVYTPNSGYGGGPSQGGASVVKAGTVASMTKSVRALATALGTNDIVELDTTNDTLEHSGGGRQFTGTVYVATPQLLAAFGIKASDVERTADVLTMRPGLSSISHMELSCGVYFGAPDAGPGTNPCPKGSTVATPMIEQVSALPSGTSAPNTVITEHAVHQLGLHPALAGWFIETAHPLSAAQINGARLTAARAGLTIETKNDLPTSAQVTDWATLFGILLALGILAMSVGLIRSETAGDLRVLAATGASGRSRRTLTAATAGALALLGAVMGTIGAYVATIAYASTSSLDGLSSLSNIPARNLLLIVVGMPLFAVAAGWLLAGREPADMTHQPTE
jgi:putative ABC transport system permease protein